MLFCFSAYVWSDPLPFRGRSETQAFQFVILVGGPRLSPCLRRCVRGAPAMRPKKLPLLIRFNTDTPSLQRLLSRSAPSTVTIFFPIFAPSRNLSESMTTWILFHPQWWFFLHAHDYTDVCFRIPLFRPSRRSLAPPLRWWCGDTVPPFFRPYESSHQQAVFSLVFSWLLEVFHSIGSPDFFPFYDGFPPVVRPQ